MPEAWVYVVSVISTVMFLFFVAWWVGPSWFQHHHLLPDQGSIWSFNTLLTMNGRVLPRFETNAGHQGASSSWRDLFTLTPNQTARTTTRMRITGDDRQPLRTRRTDITPGRTRARVSTMAGLPVIDEEEHEMNSPNIPIRAVPVPPRITPRRNTTPLGTQAPPCALFARKSRERLRPPQPPLPGESNMNSDTSVTGRSATAFPSSSQQPSRLSLPQQREQEDLLPPLPAAYLPRIRNFSTPLRQLPSRQASSPVATNFSSSPATPPSAPVAPGPVTPGLVTPTRSPYRVVTAPTTPPPRSSSFPVPNMPQPLLTAAFTPQISHVAITNQEDPFADDNEHPSADELLPEIPEAIRRRLENTAPCTLAPRRNIRDPAFSFLTQPILPNFADSMPARPSRQPLPPVYENDWLARSGPLIEATTSAPKVPANDVFERVSGARLSQESLSSPVSKETISGPSLYTPQVRRGLSPATFLGEVTDVPSPLVPHPTIAPCAFGLSEEDARAIEEGEEEGLKDKGKERAQ